jgi:retron-type reverse transcriptase
MNDGNFSLTENLDPQGKILSTVNVNISELENELNKLCHVGKFSYIWR